MRSRTCSAHPRSGATNSSAKSATPPRYPAAMEINFKTPEYEYVVTRFDGRVGRITSFHDHRSEAELAAAEMQRETGLTYDVVPLPGHRAVQPITS
jgi:hypothetical protein